MSRSLLIQKNINQKGIIGPQGPIGPIGPIGPPGPPGSGGNWYNDAIWVDCNTTTPLLEQDGKMGTPFSTFAQAILSAETIQDSLPIGPLPTQRCGTRQVSIYEMLFNHECLHCE